MNDATNHEVVIIGGGPAGLAAAAELVTLGIRDVVVIEREQHAGGVPRHCGHAGFGWREFRRILAGPAYAHRLVGAARGVQILTGTTALALEADGRIRMLAPEGIRTLQARRVLLALGARETPRAARLVSGTRPWGVFTTGALQQMVYLAGIKPCNRAVIVGSELVSFSSLLTLRHAGIRPLAMIEESARVVAPRPAEWAARAIFGTRILMRTRLVAVHGDSRVNSIEIERDGIREHIACDGIVFSGRFVPEAALLRSSLLAIDPATGGPVVDQYGRCSDPAYFAAGNLLRPVEASWTVWSEGRDVARAIAASLRGMLPQPTHHVMMQARAPVRYACPQRLAFPAPLPAALPLNLRVSEEIHGRLRVHCAQGELWGAWRHLLPETRIIVPWPADLPSATRALVVEVSLPVTGRSSAARP